MYKNQKETETLIKENLHREALDNYNNSDSKIRVGTSGNIYLFMPDNTVKVFGEWYKLSLFLIK